MVELNLSPTELGAVIQGLAAVRATMFPSAPTSHVNAPVHLPVQVQAVVPANRIAGRRLIIVRRPGFGWTSLKPTGDVGADLAAETSSWATRIGTSRKAGEVAGRF